MTGPDRLHVTGDPDADRLLATDPLALFVGMLLDQQVPMEWAFMGPWRLAQRLGTDRLDAAAIAAMDPDDLAGVFRDKPALHRFPSSMARRTQALCQHLVDHYDGQAEAVWAEADSGEELLKRLTALPGYGDRKAKIFVAVLGKRLGVAPDGWQDAAAPFGDEVPRSVADVDSREDLEAVRAFKKSEKASGRRTSD